jgi:hypothetical protein
MKLPESWRWAELKHRLVLTPEEKRVISFVIAAFLLGSGTKCHRDARPQPVLKSEKNHPTPHHVRNDGFVRPD